MTAPFLPDDRDASIQETHYPAMTCFGCGHGNPKGLHLRSYEVDGEIRAVFEPWPEFDNGAGFLNGGIISTLLDCHGAAAVMLEANRRGWHAPDGGLVPFVTAGLEVKFQRPVALHEPVQLTAELLAVAETEMTVVSHIVRGEKTLATGTALWKRFRPR